MNTALSTDLNHDHNETVPDTSEKEETAQERVVSGELVKASSESTDEAVERKLTAEAERVYAEFCKPFPSKAVKWRIGKTSSDERRGQALCYIDARNVQNRLDTTVGFTNWQTEFREVQNAKGDVVVFICRLGVRIDGEWIYKEDVAEPTDYEAMKGGVSDALKRAASQFGIGRYLYEIPSPWVDLRDGRFSRIRNSRIGQSRLKKEGGQKHRETPLSGKVRKGAELRVMGTPGKEKRLRKCRTMIAPGFTIYSSASRKESLPLQPLRRLTRKIIIERCSTLRGCRRETLLK